MKKFTLIQKKKPGRPSTKKKKCKCYFMSSFLVLTNETHKKCLYCDKYEVIKHE